MAKSSFSGDNGCVDVDYVKSSFSNTSCVEVAAHADQFIMRDTKNPAGPALVFNREEWDAFLLGVKAGEFDFS